MLNLQPYICRNPLQHPCDGRKITAEAQDNCVTSVHFSVLNHPMLDWCYCQCQIQFTLAAVNKFLGWPTSMSVSRLASQSVSQSVSRSVSWSATLLQGYYSGMKMTLIGVSYLTYPFSWSSSWSFRTRGNWLGLIIKQEYSLTPFKLQELKFVFLLTHAFY